MEFPVQLKHKLAAQSIAVDRPPASRLPSYFEALIEETKQWSGTDNNGVAVSYFFRQYALFISAQFDLLTFHNGYFACSWKDIEFGRIHNYGFNLLQTHIDSRHFTPVSPENRQEAMHFILTEQVDSLITEFRKYVKISPLILWENVLGSVVWFYATLEKREPRRTAEDIDWLLEPSNWAPIKTSYLQKLMGTASLEQAVSGPLRKTCCLYKELPAFATCTFCPQPRP